ncbi:MAG: hypothetical protein CO013_00545 [Syntrophobacterales bacterium CG_4_8_14_3_um_filter_58_8]|nr:MAG: hypothetical protein COS57_09060 [Syntrophobacterales bacterium CG03_land_8_20_14_0_80_58_14]PJC76244.1 MAG: hypothetical protein CO013_00545 [Syntrophobacterales bacterium CG_4_8_14_3_um_filter_58_8]
MRRRPGEGAEEGAEAGDDGGCQKTILLPLPGQRPVGGGIEEQADAFRKSDLEALLNDLRELVALVEGRLPEALDDSSSAAKAPKKKPVLA